MKLILASGSPRRRELLSLYTTDFEVCVSAFDERAVHAENPAALAQGRFVPVDGLCRRGWNALICLTPKAGAISVGPLPCPSRRKENSLPAGTGPVFIYMSQGRR